MIVYQSREILIMITVSCLIELVLMNQLFIVLVYYIRDYIMELILQKIVDEAFYDYQ